MWLHKLQELSSQAKAISKEKLVGGLMRPWLVRSEALARSTQRQCCQEDGSLASMRRVALGKGRLAFLLAGRAQDLAAYIHEGLSLAMGLRHQNSNQ